MQTTSFKSLVLAGLLASAGFATMAQPAAGQDGGRMPMAGTNAAGMHQGGPMGGMHNRMGSAKWEAKMAKRQDALKAKLKLAPEQEGAWTTFTTAMKPPARGDMKRPDRAEMEKLTTPERIDKMHALRTERMAAMNAAMDKREDATKTFYGALNADQKTVFDAEHARMGAHYGDRHSWRGAGYKGGDKPAKSQ
ncbi:Spy/CpxP family protein refolding chaperone [Candidatus Aalborgicola defluviihabitans]|jgi:hypothetical protein|uniref:Spy/CpxP family protein refolding chaperone n=1 Tax=Candidatus Aalborgicola defluviihabitans TaxID=3386187 RepID=UPI001D8537A5|nr:Spy/CpxP family protein refolding chaperone [Burkholderiales bacterium]MBK6570242.1 Spy/CpxP family protein refolding chaperone [Burkholderiales bacterium]MBK7315068.1 Spy/CpxP family protein refolding chaperone [Burkholderiales bacterium]MBL0242510.1 Spy/CpxP family protein refolding chaperone [Rhodoferax sp.]